MPVERRGVPLADAPLEISGHAIDSASLRIRKLWHQDRGKDEGLHRWLLRVGMEALNKQEPDEKQRIKHKGIVFVFEPGEIYWTMKTCMREKK